MNTRKLILAPTAGLCNRMNAILCAIALKKTLDWDIQVYWENTKDCKVDFQDLFLPIEGISVNRLLNFWMKPGTKKNLYIPYIIRKLYFDLCLDGNKSTFKDITPMLLKKKHIYIHSYNRFSTQDITESVGKIFKPTPELQKSIDETTSQYTNRTIGIHIRRTDNAAAIDNNPLEKFQSIMEQEIAKYPSVKFYLASDDQEVKQRFCKLYKDKVITRDIPLCRDSKEGMKEAVIDLYCLAKCSKIIGSSHSTYSMMASWLYDAPLIV